MSIDITGGVPGINSERLVELAEEAEEGYDIHALTWEPNPHFQTLPTVPEDLTADILDRANRDHTSPEDVIRAALEQYLKSA